jgi:mannose-1-phosphate guanylyltransferase
MASELWSIVLAAGTGRRLSALTGGRPKPFWRLDGVRSLLDETLDRVAPLATPDRTVLVLDRRHQPFLDEAPDVQTRARVVFQPADRGTAMAVLRALLPVIEGGPDAVVLITPADHGVADPSGFRHGIRDAVAHVGARPDGVVLFGVEPSVAHADYGWITPASVNGSPLRPVAAFVEQPPADVARRLFESGALWNTRVVVAQVGVLLELYQRHVPELAQVLAEAARLRPRERDAFLTQQYRVLPACDFSRHVLTRARHLCAYAWPVSIGWSDLDTPERLLAWLDTRAAYRGERDQAAEPAA